MVMPRLTEAHVGSAAPQSAHDALPATARTMERAGEWEEAEERRPNEPRDDSMPF
jgi:hypothetical protein